MEGWERFWNDSAGGCARSCGGCFGLRVVGVVDAGEAVGDDLGSGSGGCFGGLLVGELLGGCGLGFGGGSPYSEIMLSLRR